MTPPDQSRPDLRPEGPPLNACYRRGFWQAFPFLLAIIPFALVFGVLARTAGFDLVQTNAMSILVLAGASQLTIIELMQQQAPTLIVILSALAVNLRMVMYSASLAQYLGHAPPLARAAVAYGLIDQSYVLAFTEYERQPRLTMQQRLAFFAGSSTVLVPTWIVATHVGAVLGHSLPVAELGFDIVVPVLFIAMIAPGLRSAPHLVAASVSVVLALMLHWLPSGLGLLVAAPCAMLAGAATEQHLNRRRAARLLGGSGGGGESGGQT